MASQTQSAADVAGAVGWFGRDKNTSHFVAETDKVVPASPNPAPEEVAMDPALKTARIEIASEIGADVGSFTPPEQKRFLGPEIMAAIGGAMLYAFLKGMAKKIGEKVGEKVGEKIGEPLAEFIGHKIDELTVKDKAAQDHLLEEAHRDAKQEVVSARLTPSEMKAIAQIVEADMVQALSEKAPDDVSMRIARKVSSVAVRIL
jgi:hypothetical protein